MSIRALITEGIGPGGTIPFLLTGGLGAGAAVAKVAVLPGAAPPTIEDIWEDFYRRRRAHMLFLENQWRIDRLTTERKERRLVSALSVLPRAKRKHPLLEALEEESEEIRAKEEFEEYIRQREMDGW